MSNAEVKTPESMLRYCYRDELICEYHRDGVRHIFRLYDAANDITYELGKNEMALARLFNGVDDLIQIQLHAQTKLNAVISIEKLERYQSRLIELGILTSLGEEGGLKRDPATGITYGPLKRYLLINLVKMNPQPALDKLYRWAPWICSLSAHILLMSAAVLILSFLGFHWAEFRADVYITYIHSWSWMVWHYPVILSSIALHELGHALSCRHYRVRVTDFGIGIYTLLATGWVRPEQRKWSSLLPGQRAITILMGPVASLYYTALGVVIWYITSKTSAFHPLGVVMIVASTLSLIPTLLPIFNGDTYLALTEYFNQPRLRQRALRYCRQYFAGKPQAQDKNYRLYWVVSTLTVIGWVLSWCGIVMLVWRFLP